MYDSLATRVGYKRSGTDLLAVLICYNIALCRASICAENDPTLKETADDGSAGACGFGQWQALALQEVVSTHVLD